MKEESPAMSHDLHALVASMTLEEKAGLCSGADFWHTKAVERLGIPAMLVSDGPHGLRTVAEGSANPNDSIRAVCFPAGCAAAASFDPALVRREGETLGREARSVGVGVLLGPAVNIKRSPLCGRNFEYYSEDPCLAGQIAAAFIQGVQSQGVGTSLKHFAANNQEYHRMYASSEMEERTLREIYLPAFEQAVREAQPWTVMCSYNKINGTYASENPYLLTQILRREWGFEGFVMSDWGAVSDRVKGLEAGLELEMPGSGGINDAAIVAAVREGRLEEAVLDRAVLRMLNILLRWADLDAATPRPALDRQADHHAAVAMAEECAVLLKNKGVLPLQPDQHVVYIGGFAKTPRFQGGGSSHINTDNIDNALDVAAEKHRRVQYVQGFPNDFDQRDEAEFLRAVKAAGKADVAVIFAGLPDSFESEGYDRKHMRLPDCQNNLIARVAAVQKNTVVVLHTGSPVECPWADDVAGVLCMYLGGEGVGRATDALLYGDANPSGRLPETWPLRLEDTPCYLDFPGDGTVARYNEGVYVGYRWYDARNMPVRWPFGHGLGYARFIYRDARLSAPALEEDGTVTVSVGVKNTGEVTGKEVVQLYINDATGTPGRPPKELRHFAKIKLEPGEERRVSFTLTRRDLCWYNQTIGDWYAAPGRYELRLGHSSRDIRVTVPLEYRTTRPAPLQVDEDTLIGALLKDPRTAPVLRPALEKLGTAAALNGDGGGAVNTEMMMAMFEGMPLRRLGNFGGPEVAQALPALVEQLQAAVR